MTKLARLIGAGALATMGAVLCLTTALDRTGERGAVMPLVTTLAYGPIVQWRQAAQAIKANDLTRAAALARYVVARDPVRAEGLGLLGLVGTLKQTPEQARAAYLVAGALGWREPVTQLYWLNDALTQGDATVVAQRLDALQRTGFANPIVPNAVMALERLPEGRVALAERLSNSPRWAEGYLTAIPTLPSDEAIDARVATLRLGRNRGWKPDCSKIGAVAKALVAVSKPKKAANLWFSMCRPRSDPHAALDGSSFARADDETDSPFAWGLAEQGDIDVRVAKADEQASGDALFVASNSSVSEVAAQRLIALRPGSYRISWRVADDAASATNLATVTMTCAGSRVALQGTPIATSASKRGPALNMSTVTVPATACGLQWIAIRAEPKALDTPVQFHIFDLKTSAVPVGSKPGQ